MIATSRKRTKRTERIRLTAAVRTKSAATATGNSSHVHIGSTPQARMKTRTMTRLRQKLKKDVTTVASGITRRGNWVLRTTPSWATTEVTAAVVASWKKVNWTIPSSSRTG